MQNNIKRSINDRRQEKSKATFPVRCSNNAIVLSDRRFRCERRLESLDVSESVISQDEFMSMFKYNSTAKYVNSTSTQNSVDGEAFDNCLIND